MDDNAVSPAVIAWWILLCIFALVGIVLWLRTARAFAAVSFAVDPVLRTARRRQLWLSGVYAFGCAFRAVLPRADVQRIVLVDSWLSSVLVGRSVATVAELCFVAQWALMMREISVHPGGELARFTARIALPTIAVAEVCSWYAVITTNFLGNAIEQSLWNITVALLTVSLLRVMPGYDARLRRWSRIWIGVGAGFCVFVTLVDVPMYVSRFLADQAHGRQYFGFFEGLADLNSRWVVTFAWPDWREEMAWMALYFSAAVWLSVSLVRVPWLGRVRAGGEPLVVEESAVDVGVCP